MPHYREAVFLEIFLKGGEFMGRKKTPSLAYQIRSAVNNNFREGTSKRAAKMSENGTGSTVYSYGHRKKLIEFGTQFANYCKSEFNIKQLKDINQTHIDSFLKHKATTCADTTLKTYYQHISKLNKCVNASFSSCKADWTKGVMIPAGANNTKQRDAKMSRESMDKVLGVLDPSIASHRGIFIAEALGTRVEETVTIKGSDIDLNKGTVHVIGKGGRPREIPIPEERIEAFKGFREDFGDSRIVDIDKDSVNEEFRELRKELDIHDLDGTKSGIHAIRKLYATEHFEELVSQGMDEKQAWDATSDLIGHGENRNDLFKTYVVRD